MSEQAAAFVLLDRGLPINAAAVEPAAILVLGEGEATVGPALLARLLAALSDPGLAAAVADLGPDGGALAMRQSDADLLETTVAVPGRALAALRTALARRGRVETVSKSV